MSQFWLVKLPSFVTDEWAATAQQAASEGKEMPLVGSISFDRTNLSQGLPDMTIRLNTKNTELPTDYKLAVRKTDTTPMVVFSERRTVDRSGDGERTLTGYRLEGNVELTADVKPDLESPEYRALLQRRARGPQRSTLAALHQDEGGLLQTEVTNAQEQSRQAAAKRKADEQLTPTAGPRSKDDQTDDQRRADLFRLFNERQFYTIKELMNRLPRVPVNVLKALLSEVCVYHTKGDNRTNYELKPEFRTADDIALAEATAKKQAENKAAWEAYYAGDKATGAGGPGAGAGAGSGAGSAGASGASTAGAALGRSAYAQAGSDGAKRIKLEHQPAVKQER